MIKHLVKTSVLSFRYNRWYIITFHMKMTTVNFEHYLTTGNRCEFIFWKVWDFVKECKGKIAKTVNDPYLLVILTFNVHKDEDYNFSRTWDRFWIISMVVILRSTERSNMVKIGQNTRFLTISYTILRGLWRKFYAGVSILLL